MKKTTLLLAFFLYLFSTSVAQTLVSYSSEKDVFNAKSFLFCGFDYTHLRMHDADRMGKVVKTMFPGLTKFLVKEASQKKMEIWLRMPKDSITYDTAPSDSLNVKISNAQIVVPNAYQLPKDSLAAIVKNYQLTKKDGIAYSIVFESFDRPEKTASGYLVFFDILSRNILYSSYVSSFNGNQYTHLSDWKATALEAARKMIEAYNASKKAYKKSEAEVK